MYLRFQPLFVKFWHHVLRLGRLSTEQGDFLSLEETLKKPPHGVVSDLDTMQTDTEEKAGWCRRVSKPLLKHLFVHYARGEGTPNPEGAWNSFLRQSEDIFSATGESLVQTQKVPTMANPNLLSLPELDLDKIYPAATRSLPCVLLGPLLKMRDALADYLHTGACAELLFPGDKASHISHARALMTSDLCLTTELRQESGNPPPDINEIRLESRDAGVQEGGIDIQAMQEFVGFPLVE